MSQTPSRPIRILMGKSGLEEHDRGVRYLNRRLVEAGMEVIYAVFHHPEEMSTIAVDEDVDIVGISSSAGGHLSVIETLKRNLAEAGREDLPILIGGIIPNADHEDLHALGVIGIFGPGSSPEDVIDTIRAGIQSYPDVSGQRPSRDPV